MNKRSACKINGYKYPAADKLSGRASTVCRSMASTLLKREPCTPETEQKWLKFFPEKKCAYCGKDATHLDHLYAFIVDRRPTGYGTEPANLVPCCEQCNQPKGNMYWEDYMRSDKCKHVGDAQTDNVELAMEKRIANIKAFQKEMPPNVISIDETCLKKWDEMLLNFDEALKKAQKELDDLKSMIYFKS